MMHAVLGSISALLAVTLGAFGAHVLKDRLSPEMLTIFETGVRYQFYHAFALLASAWAIHLGGQGLARGAGWCFVAGTILFSGSLYVLTLSGVRWLGAITPLGGVAFLAGWTLLALQFWRLR